MRKIMAQVDSNQSGLEWHSVVESAPSAFVLADAEGRIVLINARTEKLFGYPREELIGQPVEMLIPERYRDGHYEDRRQYMADPQARPMGVGRDLWGKRKDGSEVPMEIGLSPIQTDKGTMVLASILDISERKRAEEELEAARQSAERAKAVAEQASRAKDHFLAVLSHELRTPLTPVMMGLSMLQKRSDLATDVRETLDIVHRHVDMEARLIDDLLDITRIAHGKIELQKQRVQLCTVIQRTVEVCKPDIDARGLHFDVDLGPAEAYWVEADVARLQQVFWNLLKNAVKFTPYDGCVGVRCKPNGKDVVVEVNDSGIGIEPEALSRVFNSFEQAERLITRQFGGLGLGLAISRALVEMHGGTIYARSEGRDKGATFCVHLPLAKPLGQHEEIPLVVDPNRATRSLRILLVEDHSATAKMMQLVLTSAGHTVEMAGDVATALELAGQHSFDLLVSDLGLPDGDGHALMRQLRQYGHRFPGIALSGYGQAEDIQRSLDAGFAAHLTKPASRESVIEAVASAAVGQPT